VPLRDGTINTVQVYALAHCKPWHIIFDGYVSRAGLSLGLASVATCSWQLAGHEAWHAHRAKALDTLARGWGSKRWFRGIWIWALHRNVTINGDDMVRRKAGRATLTLIALQLEGWQTLDVRTTRHQPATLAFIVAMVYSATCTARLTHLLGLSVRWNQLRLAH